MASRRTVSSNAPKFSRPDASAPRPRNTSGTTMPFEAMMASATHSTITMAVAAERPPTNAASASTSDPAASGRASTNMSVSTLPAGKRSRPPTAIGTTNRLISTK